MSDKTFIVTKEEMDPKMYELLMLDVERIRKSYGKEYTNKGKVAGTNPANLQSNSTNMRRRRTKDD